MCQAVGQVVGEGQDQDQDQDQVVGKVDVTGSVDQPVSTVPGTQTPPYSLAIAGVYSEQVARSQDYFILMITMPGTNFTNPGQPGRATSRFYWYDEEDYPANKYYIIFANFFMRF